MVVLRWALFGLDHRRRLLALDQSSPGADYEDRRGGVAYAIAPDANYEAILPAVSPNSDLADILLQRSVCLTFIISEVVF